jgi:hypothetical protein
MYDTLPAEIHWLWYHKTHCQVKYTGRGTVLPGEIRWLWYRMTMLYGTTTSVFHLVMRYAVPQPVYFTWQCVIRYHDQCILPGNVLCGTTTSVFHLAIIHWSWYRITHCQLKYTGCGIA